MTMLAMFYRGADPSLAFFGYVFWNRARGPPARAQVFRLAEVRQAKGPMVRWIAEKIRLAPMQVSRGRPRGRQNRNRKRPDNAHHREPGLQWGHSRPPVVGLAAMVFDRGCDSTYARPADQGQFVSDGQACRCKAKRERNHALRNTLGGASSMRGHVASLRIFRKPLSHGPAWIDKNGR